MKKCLILLLCFVLIVPSTLAEACYGQLSIGEGTDAVQIDLFVQQEENGSFSMALSLLPDWLFDLGEWPTESEDAVDWQALLAIHGPKLQAVLDRWWKNGIHPVSAEGFYAGDLFDYASTRESAELKWGDFSLLLDIAEQAVDDDSIDPLFKTLRQLLIEAATVHPELRFDLAYYPEWNVWSLSAATADGTVLTLSLAGNDTSWQAVLGFAENGVTYYRTLDITQNASASLTVFSSLLADDRGVGYPNLKEDAIILTERATFLYANPSEWIFNSQIHQGDGTMLSSVSGTMSQTEEAGWALTVRYLWGMNQTPVFALTLSENPPEGIQEMPLFEATNTYAVFGSAEDETVQAKLESDLQSATNDLIVRVFKALPAELLTFFLNMVGLMD